VLNPAMRFLQAEREQIALELRRIEYSVRGVPEDYPIYNEYLRRCEIIEELIPQAITSDVAIVATEERLAAAHMLVQELVDAGRGNVRDDMVEALMVDIAYLEGLVMRLREGIISETFPYSLKGVDRL